MSDKYAALKQAAEGAFSSWSRYMTASTKDVLALLAERDADRARIAELELRLSQQQSVASNNLDMFRRADARIAELEARTLTVKLPDCDLGAVQHMSGGSDDYCNGFVDGTQNAIKCLKNDCADAGISLKIEGE